MNNALYDISDRADAALAATVSTTGVPGVVQVESFSGANDAAKMSAALSYAAAQTRVPWLQLPARVFNTGSNTYAAFTGMKIMGPGNPIGPMNEEISSGKPVPGKWQTTCGNGASSLIQATSAVYDTNFSGITFHGGSNSQIFRSTVNTYAAEYNTLSFYGVKNAFGNISEKWLGTQFRFTGHWTAIATGAELMTLGGSDAQLFMEGYLNANGTGAGAGRYIVNLQTLSKTDVGYMYLTAENDWGGVKVTGPVSSKLSFFGGAYEGRSQSVLATRPVIDLAGGSSYFYGPWLGQVSSAVGTVNGVIHQSGGVAYFYGGTYWRGSATDQAFPVLYQTGGVAQFHGLPVSGTSEQIRIRWSTGTTNSYPTPSNGVF